MNKPVLLAADKDKKIYDLPDFFPCGMAGDRLYILKEEDLIPLPPTSEIFVLPKRYPIGFSKNKFHILKNFNAVSCFIPPGYVGLLSAAYKKTPQTDILPLFSYSPVAWFKNKFYAPAIKIDKRKVHDIRFMDMSKLKKSINSFKKTKNRLIRHLQTCALSYKCPNAMNFFLSRYECPLPTSPICNSKCIGCISFQPPDSCPPTQPRIKFIPTPDEIAEIALLHIKNTRNPVLSFGQGCEGEPLLAIDVIEPAIKIIRKKTNKGTINMNTNASAPDAIESLCKAGLDSVRVSLNSARKEFYDKYYKPQGYTFGDVLKSIYIAKKYNKFVSINYLTMPGFTDEENEFKKLIKFIEKTKIDMIQWRNLNYDPQEYFRKLGIKHVKNPLGIKNVILNLKKRFPKLRHGYFNLPKGKW